MNSIIHMDADRESLQANMGFFDLYHKDIFKQPARETWINGWKIEYMAIADARTIHRTPIVIVGGAFQNFNSYKYCVEQLFAAGPIILIDLPSMGANQQIRNRDNGLSASTLELTDLATMLGQWLDLVQLGQVSVMGMSLGSVVASWLAHLRPEVMSRLVLMGVMQKTRKSWRMILQESLALMQENRMEEFGEAVILYLVNHARLAETRMSPTAKRLFFRQMAEFTGTERERYEINCNRLLRLTHVPIPQCETLVAAGQYDSFTLPHENANFALQCPNMQFALIANADHVPQLQRRKETMSLFATFLNNLDLNTVQGIIPLSREQIQQLDRRGEPRIAIDVPARSITHRHTGSTIAVDVVDMSFFGVLLRAAESEQNAELMAAPRDMALQLSDEEGEFSLECLLFEQDDYGIRALFKHGSFAVAERLQRFMARQQAQSSKL